MITSFLLNTTEHCLLICIVSNATNRRYRRAVVTHFASNLMMQWWCKKLIGSRQYPQVYRLKVFPRWTSLPFQTFTATLVAISVWNRNCCLNNVYFKIIVFGLEIKQVWAAAKDKIRTIMLGRPLSQWCIQCSFDSQKTDRTCSFCWWLLCIDHRNCACRNYQKYRRQCTCKKCPRTHIILFNNNIHLISNSFVNVVLLIYSDRWHGKKCAVIECWINWMT